MDLRQRENESFLDWKIRLVSAKKEKEIDLDWIELVDILGLDCSGDHLRKVSYGLYEAKNHYESKVVETIDDNEILDKLTVKQLELLKERKKLQSEKQEIHKWLREQGRSEIFYEKIEERLKYRLPIEVPNYTIQRVIGDRDCVIEIADAHYGREIVVKGLEGEILNEYNPKVFQKRMWDYLNQLIVNLEKENQKHVHLFNLSDSIDGILRMSQLQVLQMGIIDSAIDMADFLTIWLNELSKHVYVDYYAAEGNHTEIRPLGSKKGDFPDDNMEKVVTRILMSDLKDNPNVTIHPNKYFQYVDVVGTKILATHGQDEKSLEQSVKDYAHTYRKPVHMLLTGHLHSHHEKTIGIDEGQSIRFVQVPSLCGIDDFSMKLKKTANAGALIQMFERGYGRTNLYDITLK